MIGPPLQHVSGILGNVGAIKHSALCQGEVSGDCRSYLLEVSAHCGAIVGEVVPKNHQVPLRVSNKLVLVRGYDSVVSPMPR